MTNFLDHAPLILIVLPLLGMALVWFAALGGEEAVVWTARTNVLLSVAVAFGMLFHFDRSASTADGAQRVQMRSVINWMAEPLTHQSQTQAEATPVGPRAWFSVGVDGLSLWFVALVPLLVCLALSCFPSSPRSLSSLLFVEASAVAAFSSQDLLLLLCSSGTLTLALARLAGVAGSKPEDEAQARRFLVWNGAADLILLMFVAGLASTVALMNGLGHPQALRPPPFDLNVMTSGVQEIARRDGYRQIWLLSRGWLCGALLLSILMRGSVFPFHRRGIALLKEVPASIRMLLVTLPLQLALWLTIRLLIPCFPELLSAMINWPALAGLLTLFSIAFIKAAEEGSAAGSIRLTVTITSLALIGLVCGTVEGLVGGTMIATLGIAAAAILQTLPTRRWALPVSALVIATGGWLICLAISRQPSVLPGGMLIGIPAITLCLLTIFASVWRESTSSESSTKEFQASTLSQTIPIWAFPVLGLVIMVVACPHVMTETATTAAGRLLAGPSHSLAGEE